MNNATACFNLALCHRNGNGIPADQQKSRLIFTKACVLGDLEDQDGCTRCPKPERQALCRHGNFTASEKMRRASGCHGVHSMFTRLFQDFFMRPPRIRGV